MNRINLEQLLAFVAQLDESKCSNYTAVTLYLDILKQARKLAKIDTDYCNGVRYTGEGEYDKVLRRVYAKLDNLIMESEQPLEYYHQHDPRGVSLYVAKIYKQRGHLLEDATYTMYGVPIY